MLTIISPAKTLDFSKGQSAGTFTTPAMLKESRILVRQLKQLSPPELGKLLGVSEKLAELNHERYQTWKTPFNPANAKQAILAYKGDVYTAMNVADFLPAEFEFAQQHLRMLSGLHGVLRPLDLIQAYRLEMSTRLETERGKNLYEFWVETITDSLGTALEATGERTLLNLASVEYSKAIKPRLLKGHIITANFKQGQDGEYRNIGLFAKQARGLMTRYIMKNEVENVEDVKSFDGDGYRFNQKLSSPQDWVFTRRQPTN